MMIMKQKMKMIYNIIKAKKAKTMVEDNRKQQLHQPINKIFFHLAYNIKFLVQEIFIAIKWVH